MSRLTLDAYFARQLQSVTMPTELCDPQGRILGRYIPDSTSDEEMPLLSAEEIERGLQQESFSTEEVLKHLEQV
jgi:hypothetical protein